MAANNQEQIPIVPPVVDPDIDALLAADTVALQTDLAQVLAAKVARVEQAAAAVAARESVEVGSDQFGKEKKNDQEAEGEIVYANIDRSGVERWFKTRTNPWLKLDETWRSLKILSEICGEISERRGWAMLMERTASIPSHELTDAAYRKHKFAWLENQKAALRDENRKSDVVSPEEWDVLYMQLHDLLVVSQAVLFELRAQPRDTGIVDGTKAAVNARTVGQSEKIGESAVADKLAQAQALLNEWQGIRSRVMRGKLGAFDEALRKRLGITTLPSLESHANWLQTAAQRTDWKDEEGKKSLRLLNERLTKYPLLVAASKAVIGRFERPAAGADDMTRRRTAAEADASLDVRVGDVWMREKDGKIERVTLDEVGAEKVRVSFTTQAGSKPVVLGMRGSVKIDALRQELRSGGYRRELQPLRSVAVAKSESESRMSFNERLDRMRYLIERLKSLESEFGDATLRKAIRELRGVERLPSTKRIMEWFAGHEKSGSWKGKSAAADRTLLVDDALPTIESMVRDAEVAAKTLREVKTTAIPNRTESMGATAASKSGETALGVGERGDTEGERKREAEAIDFLEHRQQERIEALRKIETKEEFDRYAERKRHRLYSLDGDIDIEDVRHFLRKKGFVPELAEERIHARAQALQGAVKEAYAAARAKFYPEGAARATRQTDREPRRRAEIAAEQITVGSVWERAGTGPSDIVSITVTAIRRDGSVEVQTEFQNGATGIGHYETVALLGEELTVDGYKWSRAEAGAVATPHKENRFATTGNQIREGKPEKTFEQRWKQTPSLIYRWNQLYGKYRGQGLTERIKELRKAEGRLVGRQLPSISVIQNWIEQRQSPGAWSGSEGEENRTMFIGQVYPDLVGMVNDAEIIAGRLAEAEEQTVGNIESRLAKLRNKEELVYEDGSGNAYLVQNGTIKSKEVELDHDLRPMSAGDAKIFRVTLSDGTIKSYDLRALVALIYADGWKLRRPNGSAAKVTGGMTTTGNSPESGRSPEQQRQEFVSVLGQKVGEFIVKLDAKLRMEGMDADMRTSHIAAHMSLVVTKCIERYGAGIAWSSEDRKRMIKESILAIDTTD